MNGSDAERYTLPWHKVACAFMVASTLAVLGAAESVYANEAEQLQQAREVATILPPRLTAALQQEIGKTGFEGAIAVCGEIAPQMAQEISRQSGWNIRRVSLKARNDARAIPDAWERAALEEFDLRAAAGEPAEQLEKAATVGEEFRYLKALPTQPLCLGCHGVADQLSPGIQSALAQRYPNDLATGYSVGQIRGAISVRRPN